VAASLPSGDPRARLCRSGRSGHPNRRFAPPPSTWPSTPSGWD